MKQLLHYFLFFVTAGVLFTSCQKEISAETNNAIGTLTEDVNGNCAAITTNGSYVKDVLLDASNYLDVQVNIIQPGNYVIKTNTVNGYYFYDSSSIVNTGLNTIRLKGYGKPLVIGTDALVVSFGTSECEISIIVTATAGGGTGIAKFTLVGSPTSCTGAAQTNNYFVGIPTAALTHKDTIYVDVTEIGTYTITATTTPSNGLTFSKSGSFSTIGPNKQVILEATGTPSTAGSIPYTITTTSPASNCGFNVTVLGPAAFTMNCAGVTLSGIYQQGTPIGLNTNTITIPVTVTTPGFYNITATTTPATNNNGITFVGVGPLTPTTTSIVLYALPGTPVVNGNFIYNVAAGGATCGVVVNYLLPPPPATYTFNCGAPIYTGTYQTGTSTTGNTVSILVTSLAGGTYNINSSTTVNNNGVTFSGTGILQASASPQVVVLNATGIPTATGSFTYTLKGIGNVATCTVNRTYTAPLPSNGTITTFINGGTTLSTFNLNASGNLDITTFPGNSSLVITGATNSSPTSPLITLSVSKAGPILANTTFTTTSPMNIASGQYDNTAGSSFYASPLGGNITITITSITTTPPLRIVGTFFGTLKDNVGLGPNTSVFTTGNFDIPYQ
jgi:hypothetical protein